MKITASKKLIGTIEMIAAAIVIVAAVFLAGGKFKEWRNKPTVPEQTVSETQPVETTEATTAEPTTVEQTTELPTIGEWTVTKSIVVTSNSAMEMYSIAKERLTNYANVINTFAAKVPDRKVYCLLAPIQIAFYGPDEYRTGSHSQPDGINIAYSALSPNVTSIDAYTELSKHTNEYIYFRTDHHWTARGAYYAYKAFCNKNGFNCTPLENYETGRLDNFVGTMYNYTQAQVLVDNPDYVEYFMPIVSAEGQYFSNAAMNDGRTLRIISTDITARGSKYMCFIQGDKALERIVTSNQNGRKILVIKESYGNAMVPFLLENYNEVFVLDPRQDGVKDMNLPQFVIDNGINEVLFINYVFAPSNKTYMNALTNIVNKPTAAEEQAAAAAAAAEAAAAAAAPAETPQG